jgi:hypothetical protein
MSCGFRILQSLKLSTQGEERPFGNADSTRVATVGTEQIGTALAPVRIGNRMTGNQLKLLHQNSFYIEACEFFLREATILSEILEGMDWGSATPEQRDAVRLQCERTKQTRLVLKQLRELVVSAQESSSPALTNHMAADPVAIDDVPPHYRAS